MNVNLTNPQQPALQTDVNTAATNFLNDLESAFTDGQTDQWKNVPTSFRDPTPIPAIGDAPPVAQPGRPPMSQKATDASALMLSAGVASLPLGAAVTGILWASGAADPVVVGMICGAPAALILALSRLVRGAKQVVEAAPAEHHHHHNGPVYQDNSTTHHTTRAVWANNTHHPK